MADDAAVLYRDRWVTCTERELVVRGYYFPFGAAKHIPYGEIRGVTAATMGALTGRWRIWGTASARYWAHLDPGRPHKTTAVVLDLGRRIRPVVTPDDPERVQQILAEHAAG